MKSLVFKKTYSDEEIRDLGPLLETIVRGRTEAACHIQIEVEGDGLRHTQTVRAFLVFDEIDESKD